MKRKALITAYILLLICVALLGACGAVDMSSLKDGADVVDSAYFVDKETGEYSAVVIVENNGLNPLKSITFTAKAYDEDGGVIDPLEDGVRIMSLTTVFDWLCKGERSAACFSTAIDNAGLNEWPLITDRYEAIPDTLEWKIEDGFTRADPELVPHGLSVKDCVLEYGDDVSGTYNVTIQNESGSDYTAGSHNTFTSGDKEFTIAVIAVYRDEDGKIKDAVEMYALPADIPAGSETDLTCVSSYVSEEDYAPEYYIRITNY